jgi:DNA-binding NtrC family response regulator
MKKKIAVLAADPDSMKELSSILNCENYAPTEVYALSSLEALFDSGHYLAAVIDIDSVQIDNRAIRKMALKYPGVRFLCTSRDRFHPELKDAICYHIYACLNKPVDPDELLFWIKCIYEEEKILD